MEITVFAKKAKTRDNREFTRYISTLTRKDGSKQTMTVKFREECGLPSAKDCPMNIKFEKVHGNISSREFTREDTGEIGTSYTLWISKWTQGAPYVDHSLDDFE